MDRQKLIDDIIKVDKVNDGGQVFERGKQIIILILLCVVSRIQAHSEVHKMKIELDVNTDIYPMEEGACYKLCLATSVNSDGSDGFDIIRYENQEANEGGEKHGSLVDQFQYVMHGKIFKYQLEQGESEGQKKM